MSAEEKKYVYPEVEQDYEEENDNIHSTREVDHHYDVDEDDYKQDNSFRLTDLKDSDVSEDFQEKMDRMYEKAKSARYCPYCGDKLVGSGNFCPTCGNRVSSVRRNDGKPLSKWVAFALCFFGGVFGAHKFYEGKIGMGVAYIFTGGLFGIGVLVDLVSILLKDDPYFVEK